MRRTLGLLMVMAGLALGPGAARADVFDFQYGGGYIEGGVSITALPTGVAGEYLATAVSGDFEVGNYGSPVDYRVTGLLAAGAYQGNDNLVFYPGPSGAFDAAGVSWVLDNGTFQNVSTYVYGGAVGYDLTTNFVNPYFGVNYGGTLDLVWFSREETAATPEPGTMRLVGTGLLGVMGVVRRRVQGCKDRNGAGMRGLSA